MAALNKPRGPTGANPTELPEGARERPARPMLRLSKFRQDEKDTPESAGMLWLSYALAETIESGKVICEDAERFIHDLGKISGFPPRAQTIACRLLGETRRSPLSS